MTADKINTTLLIQQLRQGNEKAFTSLYDQFSRQLYRNILYMVKDNDIAEELLQDLFLAIWQNRENIDPEKSLKSYLFKIAENLVYMHFRKLAKDKRLLNSLISSYTDFDTNAEEVLISKENHQLLHKAIESLSPQRREVYSLCKLEGKSYEEVSKELGISTSTIRDHIVKANKAVKTYFYLNQDIAVVFITAELLKHFK